MVPRFLSFGAGEPVQGPLEHLLKKRVSQFISFSFQFLASAGFDRQIYLWKVYEECDNIHIFSPSHSGAIVDLQFTPDGNKFVTASTDKTVGLFDTITCQRIKRFKGKKMLSFTHPHGTV